MNLKWRDLPRAEGTRIITAINPFLGEYALPAGTSLVRVAKLSFYVNYQFYELVDIREQQPKSMFALHNPQGGEDSTFVLDWTNRPIYTANEHDPINLKAENIGDYVSFFFACVQGPYGPMTVVENLDTPPDAAEDVRQAIKDIMKMTPPRVTNVDRTTGTFTVYAGMLFKDCIFKTKMEVSSNGLIQILDHELAIGGLNDGEKSSTASASLS